MSIQNRKDGDFLQHSLDLRRLNICPRPPRFQSADNGEAGVRQQADPESGIYRWIGPQGLASAREQFESAGVLSAGELEVTGGQLHKPLDKTFLFANRLIPERFPDFMRFEEMARVKSRHSV